MFQWLSTLILALRGPLKTPEVSMGNRTRIGWLRLEGSEESSFVVMRNSPSVRMWHHQIELLSPCNNQISFPSKFLLMCTKLLVNYTPILLFHGQHGVNKEWTTPLCAVHKTYSFPSFFFKFGVAPRWQKNFFLTLSSICFFYLLNSPPFFPWDVQVFLETRSVLFFCSSVVWNFDLSTPNLVDIKCKPCWSKWVIVTSPLDDKTRPTCFGTRFPSLKWCLLRTSD